VHLEVGEDGRIGRVAALSSDGMRAWIRLAEGGVVNVTSRTEHPLSYTPGTVVVVTEWAVEAAPPELWPEEGPAATARNDLWVGVVKLRLDDVTVVDVGGSFRRIPTSSQPYEKGNTVEGTDAEGVARVLDEQPIRYVDTTTIDESVIAGFRREPAQGLSFEDFGGLSAVKRRARELIEISIAHRDRLMKIGAKPVKGVLFTGLPGTGKTMLARIIASNAGATFYEISGPTIISKWVGESEELLRRIFEDARSRAPSIIFFDEIDSVASQRREDAHEASVRLVGQLLTLMDGFEPEHEVLVIAATNRQGDIDKALRRPGRFDWEINFPLPDLADRRAILHVLARAHATDDPLPHAWVAANTEHWSAAEMAGIWKEAALLAAGDEREMIMIEDYLAGHERMAEQRRRVAAESTDEGEL
jgi:ATP-dependent 26S proteasome regulatory subunit